MSTTTRGEFPTRGAGRARRSARASPRRTARSAGHLWKCRMRPSRLALRPLAARSPSTAATHWATISTSLRSNQRGGVRFGCLRFIRSPSAHRAGAPAPRCRVLAALRLPAGRHIFPTGAETVPWTGLLLLCWMAAHALRRQRRSPRRPLTRTPFVGTTWLAETAPTVETLRAARWPGARTRRRCTTTQFQCGCTTLGFTAACTGTTTFTGPHWTSGAIELLAGCQTSGAVTFVPTYTCEYGTCGAPCGDFSVCGAAAPDAATTGSSNGTATGTSTGT
jgi:hypothetical protein